MKVLLVNGSARANGCPHAALTEVARALGEEGIETEQIFIGNQPLPDCIGCRKCARAFPEKFVIEGFKASVNYQNADYPTPEEAQSVGCPTGALLSADEHLNIERHEPNWSPEK